MLGWLFKKKDTILITRKAEDIVRMTNCIANVLYVRERKFYQMYIAQFITYQNIVLIGSLKVQIEQLNMLAMPKDQYNEYLNYQIKMEGGIVESIAQLWFKYFDFESQGRVHQAYTEFFRRSCHTIFSYLSLVLMMIHSDLQPQQIHSLINDKQKTNIIHKDCRYSDIMRGLQVHLTRHSALKNIMCVFQNNCHDPQGVAGQFTAAEILETASEFQQLVRIQQIPHPFDESIKQIRLFFSEWKVQQKCMHLVDTVDTIRRQIMNYRQFFNMEPVIIGMDILMPFVSFVVERSEINASAAIMYLKAVIGCNGAGYNQQIYSYNMMQIDDTAFYCSQLIEAACQVYSHASQIIDSGQFIE